MFLAVSSLEITFVEFSLQITNTNFFETTQGLEFSWAIHGDGYQLGSGILSLPLIKPQGSFDVELDSGPWCSVWTSSTAEECFITITSKLLHSTSWVEHGHTISSTQVQLPAKRERIPHVIQQFSSVILIIFLKYNFFLKYLLLY